MFNQFNKSSFFWVNNKLRSAICCVIFFSVNSSAQILWSTAAGQAWLTATNWTGNTVPAAGDIAQFGTAPTSGVTGVGINMNGVTNNGANNQAVGAIEILNTRTANFKIGNSSAAVPGILTLNGAVVNGVADVVLRNNAPGSFTIDNRQALGSSTMNIALNDAADNKIYIGNFGSIYINTVVSGTGKKLSLYGIGAGKLQLNAANTYTGLTTVGGSILQLNNTAGGTLPATNDISIENGGTLKVSSNQSLHNITLASGGTLIIDAGITLTISGTFFNNGGIINMAGTIAYATGALLYYGAGFAQITSDAEFPATAGPTGLIISNAAGVELHAVRTIAGVLNLSAGNFILNAHDFTSAGTSGWATAASHVVTNGMGKLIITNITTAAVIFPIGADNNSVNPVIISNGNGVSYGARVEAGFSIPISDASKAINRTWILQSLQTPAAIVHVRFLYTAGDGNAFFSYTAPVDHGIYLPMGFGWNINQAGLPQAGNYYVDTQVSSFLAATDLPMVIGNLGAILADDFQVQLRAQQMNGGALLNWQYDAGNGIDSIAIERSADGIHFTSLANATAGIHFFEDKNMPAGTNYYRIKMFTGNKKIIYSNVAVLFNTANDFYSFSIRPSPVNSLMYLLVRAPKKEELRFIIRDVLGRQAYQTREYVQKGENRIAINCSILPPGIYRLAGFAGTKPVMAGSFIKQ